MLVLIGWWIFCIRLIGWSGRRLCWLVAELRDWLFANYHADDVVLPLVSWLFGVAIHLFVVDASVIDQVRDDIGLIRWRTLPCPAAIKAYSYLVPVV